MSRITAVAEMGYRLATTDIGRKVGAAVPSHGKGTATPTFRPMSVVPFPWRQLGPHLAVSPEPRLISVPSGILIHPTIWPQYTNVTDKQDRQDNGPVAYREPLLA